MSEKIIKSYKGFDKNLQCRGFQYEVGKEYEIDGNIKVCNRGFHACESPLEVLEHYPIFENDLDRNRFCEVEQSGEIDREEDSTKICSSKIKIKAELKLADLINLGVEWIKEQVRFKASDNDIEDSNDSAQIGSSGVPHRLALAVIPHRLALAVITHRLALAVIPHRLIAQAKIA